MKILLTKIINILIRTIDRFSNVHAGKIIVDNFPDSVSLRIVTDQDVVAKPFLISYLANSFKSIIDDKTVAAA